MGKDSSHGCPHELHWAWAAAAASNYITLHPGPGKAVNAPDTGWSSFRQRQRHGDNFGFTFTKASLSKKPCRLAIAWDILHVGARRRHPAPQEVELEKSNALHMKWKAPLLLPSLVQAENGQVIEFEIFKRQRGIIRGFRRSPVGCKEAKGGWHCGEIPRKFHPWAK